MDGHTHQGDGPEQRQSTRTPRSEALLWRADDDGTNVVGWLLECSDEGFAFAHRGSPAPNEGDTIVAHLDPSSKVERPRTARIMRSIRVHEDLFVIGCMFAERLPVEEAEACASAELPLVVRAVRPRTAPEYAA